VCITIVGKWDKLDRHAVVIASMHQYIVHMRGRREETRKEERLGTSDEAVLAGKLFLCLCFDDSLSSSPTLAVPPN